MPSYKTLPTVKPFVFPVTIYRGSVVSANRYVISGELAGVAAAGTPPAAPVASLQFNEAGAFGGDAELTWGTTPKTLTVSGNMVLRDALTASGAVRAYRQPWTRPEGHASDAWGFGDIVDVTGPGTTLFGGATSAASLAYDFTGSGQFTGAVQFRQLYDRDKVRFLNIPLHIGAGMQASGITLVYDPIYHQPAAGANRYVTSGELSASTGTPSAPLTSIQFNEASSFGGDAELTWDTGGKHLLVSGFETVLGRVTVSGFLGAAGVVVGSDRVHLSTASGYIDVWAGATHTVRLGIQPTVSGQYGAGGGYSPPTTGLAAWYKADAITGLSDGDRLIRWSDSSGNARDATPPMNVSGTAPIYQTSIVNSLPILRFSETASGYVNLPDFMTGFSAGEVFLVIKLVADPPPTEDQTGLWNFGPTTITPTHYPWYLDSVIYEAFGTTVRKTTINPADALTSWRLYNVASQSADWTSRLDTTQLFNTGTNTVSFPSTPRIGASLDPDTTYHSIYLDADIAEFLLYDTVLSVNDRATIQNYLTQKYALAFAVSGGTGDAGTVPTTLTRMAITLASGEAIGFAGVASASAPTSADLLLRRTAPGVLGVLSSGYAPGALAVGSITISGGLPTGLLTYGPAYHGQWGVAAQRYVTSGELSTGGTTSPASPVDSIQFNEAGSFGGDAELQWFTTPKTLVVSGNEVLRGALTASGTVRAYAQPWVRTIGHRSDDWMLGSTTGNRYVSVAGAGIGTAPILTVVGSGAFTGTLDIVKGDTADRVTLFDIPLTAGAGAIFTRTLAGDIAQFQAIPVVFGGGGVAAHGVQVSGLTIHYAPILQRSAAERYIVSGELAGIAGATPGGATRAVQFNNAGAFGGTAGPDGVFMHGNNLAVSGIAYLRIIDDTGLTFFRAGASSATLEIGQDTALAWDNQPNVDAGGGDTRLQRFGIGRLGVFGSSATVPGALQVGTITLSGAGGILQAYNPLYAQSVAAANRYVTSGELALVPGIPSAPTTSLQFNEGGSFGGDAELTWNTTAKQLTVSGTATVWGQLLVPSGLIDIRGYLLVPSGALDLGDILSATVDAKDPILTLQGDNILAQGAVRIIPHTQAGASRPELWIDDGTDASARVLLAARTRITRNLQISGTTNLVYFPLYGAGSVSAANRYVVSGELSTGGATSPASPVTSLQFNEAGSFGGDAELTWDTTGKLLTVSGRELVLGNMTVSGGGVFAERIHLGPQPLYGFVEPGYSALRVWTSDHARAELSADGLTIASGAVIQFTRNHLIDNGEVSNDDLYLYEIGDRNLGLTNVSLTPAIFSAGALVASGSGQGRGVLSYGPIYQRQWGTGGARYLTSGEFAGVATPDAGIQYRASGVFGADAGLTWQWQRAPAVLTISGQTLLYGPAFQGAVGVAEQRYVTSGELGGLPGAPASPVTSIQFNEAGSFGGDSELRWDTDAKRLSVSGMAVVHGITVLSGAAFIRTVAAGTHPDAQGTPLDGNFAALASSTGNPCGVRISPTGGVILASGRSIHWTLESNINYVANLADAGIDRKGIARLGIYGLGESAGSLEVSAITLSGVAGVLHAYNPIYGNGIMTGANRMVTSGELALVPGAPASPITSIQFNNAGSFGGDAQLRWNTTDFAYSTLMLSGALRAHTLVLGSNVLEPNTTSDPGVIDLNRSAGASYQSMLRISVPTTGGITLTSGHRLRWMRQGGTDNSGTPERNVQLKQTGDHELVVMDGNSDAALGNLRAGTLVASGGQGILTYGPAYHGQWGIAAQRFVTSGELTAGTGTPSAPTTSIQFNEGGSFGGDSELRWDTTAKQLTVSGLLVVEGVTTLSGNALIRSAVFGQSPAAQGTPFAGNIALLASTTGFPCGVRMSPTVGVLLASGRDIAFSPESNVNFVTNLADTFIRRGGVASVQILDASTGFGGLKVGPLQVSGTTIHYNPLIVLSGSTNIGAANTTPVPQALLHVRQAFPGAPILRLETGGVDSHQPNVTWYQGKAQTTDATTGQIMLRLPTSSGYAYHIESKILARRTGGGVGTAGYTLTNTFLGKGFEAIGIASSTGTYTYVAENSLSWLGMVTLSGQGDKWDIIVCASGGAATTIAWHCTSMVMTVSG